MGSRLLGNQLSRLPIKEVSLAVGEEGFGDKHTLGKQTLLMKIAARKMTRVDALTLSQRQERNNASFRL